jgi:hypothetical protein
MRAFVSYFGLDVIMRSGGLVSGKKRTRGFLNRIRFTRDFSSFMDELLVRRRRCLNIDPVDSGRFS